MVFPFVLIQYIFQPLLFEAKIFCIILFATRYIQQDRFIYFLLIEYNVLAQNLNSSLYQIKTEKAISPFIMGF